VLHVSLIIAAQQRRRVDHNAPSPLAKFSEPKKKSKNYHHQQLSFEAVNSKKVKKKTLEYQILGYKDWMNGVLWA
jgi:hypothetical protein